MFLTNTHASYAETNVFCHNTCQPNSIHSLSPACSTTAGFLGLYITLAQPSVTSSNCIIFWAFISTHYIFRYHLWSCGVSLCCCWRLFRAPPSCACRGWPCCGSCSRKGGNWKTEIYTSGCDVYLYILCINVKCVGGYVRFKPFPKSGPKCGMIGTKCNKCIRNPDYVSLSVCKVLILKRPKYEWCTVRSKLNKIREVDFENIFSLKISW
jgi:hypothetical protein